MALSPPEYYEVNFDGFLNYTKEYLALEELFSHTRCIAVACHGKMTSKNSLHTMKLKLLTGLDFCPLHHIQNLLLQDDSLLLVEALRKHNIVPWDIMTQWRKIVCQLLEIPYWKATLCCCFTNGGKHIG